MNFEPDDKPLVPSLTGSAKSDQTNADITIGSLTAEALRDIARNESAQRSWRKAAIKFLISRQHKYQYHSEFRELTEEINDEANAEQEVQSLVESVIEGPLSG